MRALKQAHLKNEKSVFVEVKLSDGQYYGEMVNETREGLGSHQWSNGRSYEGTWVGNCMDGQGC